MNGRSSGLERRNDHAEGKRETEAREQAEADRKGKEAKEEGQEGRQEQIQFERGLTGSGPHGSEMDESTLNLGLHLAMEWGEDWLEPIQARLGKQRPDLSAAELQACNTICQTAMRTGHELAPQYISRTLETDFEGWANAMRKTYPWISQANLNRCFSQGCFYALK